MLGKALMTAAAGDLSDEPTRGIDVGAKIEFTRSSSAHRGRRAVLLVSSELPELIGMSDRILMLHEGRITENSCAPMPRQNVSSTAAMASPFRQVAHEGARLFARSRALRDLRVFRAAGARVFSF